MNTLKSRVFAYFPTNIHKNEDSEYLLECPQYIDWEERNNTHHFAYLPVLSCILNGTSHNYASHSHLIIRMELIVRMMDER